VGAHDSIAAAGAPQWATRAADLLVLARLGSAGHALENAFVGYDGRYVHVAAREQQR
jgi:hypothetical protein